MDTELSLLQAARRMDQQALVTIFDRYAADIYNFAMSMWNDSLKADRIVGDVFANFLEQLETGKIPKKNLRAYFFKTTYHFMVDGSRLPSRESQINFTDFTSDTANGNHSNTSSPEMDAVILAIKDHLTTNQRDVIILRYLQGFSLPEIAEIVEKEINNVKAIQKRAIDKLCDVLDQKVST